MANTQRGGSSRNGRRNSNNHCGCLNSVRGRYRWDNYPYYDGVCPDVEGDYDDDRDNDRDCDRRGGRDRDDDRDNDRKRRELEAVYGLFTANQPLAVAANGIIPLTKVVSSNGDFAVNSGMITIRKKGTYLATYTVRIPPDTEVDTTITLNVEDASQSSAITVIDTDGESDHTFAATAQTIFTAEKGDTVTLRSSDAINACETSIQPMFTLTLIRLDKSRRDD